MKLHFEPNLDYQHTAIESVCDLFRGQETCRTEFTVTRDVTEEQQAFAFAQSDLGIGNRLHLLDDEILANLDDIQIRNGLRPSASLASGDFTLEMETGTGKTYVYLRTVFELNRRYGFTKFVIVVPSVAIKEGVYKTLQITEEHFRSLYANAPFEYFLYDSSKLGQVRNFATSPQIQIMVVTVGAINKKDVNNLYKDTEKTGGEKPIDLIRATRPILIVDEPQSVDGGLEGQGKRALGEMNPLCTLRYSATHVDKHHMLYRLDAVDAYERKLVKQIEVASLEVEGGHNRCYVKLISTSNKRGQFSAKVELDMPQMFGVNRESIVAQLRQRAARSEQVYLATDPDREGEAIAWHLQQVLHLRRYARVAFDAITEKVVRGAIEAPRQLDNNLVHAQEARRGADRLVGYQVSPALSHQTGIARLSAGRVQSVALRLVVDRQREIEAFKETKHFGAEAIFDGGKWRAEWDTAPFLKEGEEYILDAALAEEAAKSRLFAVTAAATKPASKAPPPPFTTATLLQAASVTLGYPPARRGRRHGLASGVGRGRTRDDRAQHLSQESAPRRLCHRRCSRSGGKPGLRHHENEQESRPSHTPGRIHTGSLQRVHAGVRGPLLDEVGRRMAHHHRSLS